MASFLTRCLKLNSRAQVYMPPGSRLHYTPPTPPAVEVTEKIYRSQEGQDSYAEAFFFNGVKGGRYIELGANDGLEHSNTFLFHQAHSWTGTLIEANPVTYRGAYFAPYSQFELTLS